MSDYGPDIDTTDYTYRRTIFFTNEDYDVKYNFVVKLLLDESTFNFNLTKEDGTDLRLLLYGHTLNMWIAYWSKPFRKAVIFFKIPVLPANRKIDLTLLWGNSEAYNISNADEMGFRFTEDFETRPLDSSKWEGYINNTLTEYGYYLNNASIPFTTITDPLKDMGSFTVEFGLYCDWASDTWNTDNGAFQAKFVGTENDFWVAAGYINGSSSAVSQGTNTSRDGAYYGLENNSYNEITVSYNEPLDRVIMKLRQRDAYPDVEYYWPRKVEGDTRPLNLSMGGRQSGTYVAPYPTYINWLVIRDFDGKDLDFLDNSGLFIEHEYVPHQNIDGRAYGPDITSIIYNHESSFGGDPAKLSDNGYDSDANIWISDDDAVAEEYVALTLNTAWAYDVTDVKYTHYDSGHVYHYNAAKLSDNDESLYGWTYLHLTGTSGWAAIKFTETRSIGAFKIKATSDLEAAPKDYIFYGSNFNPTINYGKAYILSQGTFLETEEWQSRVLTHGAKFRYYILEILNTHGNRDVKIQEWEMMDNMWQRERRYVTQLRLHPAIVDDLEYNFPKEISLQGSNDGYTWDTLIDWTGTYTPFIEHLLGQGRWQYYSFTNTKGYWSYRLLCRGHWLAEDGRMAIAEWELHELESEEYTYHVLAGGSNNITQIWAQEGCKFEDTHKLFFTTNDYLSKIVDNRLVGYEELPEEYNDINVVQENY